MHRENGQRVFDGIMLTALLVGASVLARKSLAGTWSAVSGHPPPPDISNTDVDVREAAAWALVSGAVVGLVRLFVRRGLGRPGTPFN